MRTPEVRTAFYYQIALYGIGMAVLLFLLKWLEWRFLITHHALDIYIGLLAVLFTLLGAWVARQLSRHIIIEKEVLVHREIPFERDEAVLEKLQFTNREWEVLRLLAQGKSNAEIADQLFISLSTVKTHASNIFLKMEVKSRAQAMEKAKRLRLIP